MTSTVTSQDDEYNYPDQKLTRTCAISIPFSDFTLTSYDSGSTYSGSVTTQQATLTSDWSISPASSTSNVGVTRAYAPASGHTSGTFSIQIYAEIKNGVLTFVFSPSTTLLQMQISTTYTYSTTNSPSGAASAVSYTAPSADAYNSLSYSTTEGSLVTVPKSSNPFQTQTISFSGSKVSVYTGAKSFEWTGTISLSLGNQVTNTPKPIPDENQTDNTNDNNTGPPVDTVTPTPTPLVIPVPEQGKVQVSELQGDIRVTRAGSNTAEKITGAITLNVGDRIRLRCK